MVQNKARATYEIEKILSVENKYNAVQIDWTIASVDIERKVEKYHFGIGRAEM